MYKRQPYAYGGTQQEKAAYLREAQFRAQSLIPNSGMISTNDLVEPYEMYNICLLYTSLIFARVIDSEYNVKYKYTMKSKVLALIQMCIRDSGMGYLF